MHALPRRFRRLLHCSAAGLAVITTVPTARAQTTVYQDALAFRAALVTTGSNDLEAPSAPAAGVAPSVTGLNFGVATATLFDPSPNPTLPSTGLSQFGFNGGQSWTVGNGGTTRLEFDADLNGFGALFSGLANVRGVVFNFYRTVGSASPVETTTVGPFSFGGYEGFYGVTLTTAFRRVDIVAAGGEYFEMDDLVAGATVIPEPATLLLVGGGALALAGAARRTSRHAPRPEAARA